MCQTCGCSPCELCGRIDRGRRLQRLRRAGGRMCLHTKERVKRHLRRRHRGHQRGRPAARPGEGRRSSATRIYPGSHYVTPQEQMRTRRRRASARSCASGSTCSTTRASFLEKQRLEQRTLYDLEMMEQMGFCNGIENYSRHLSGRKAGRAAARRSSTTSPRIPARHRRVAPDRAAARAMYRGDRARKETLVEYGFRLPSALDNRPLKFEEFEAHVHRSSTSRPLLANTSSRRRRASWSSSSSARRG